MDLRVPKPTDAQTEKLVFFQGTQIDVLSHILFFFPFINSLFVFF